MLTRLKNVDKRFLAGVFGIVVVGALIWNFVFNTPPDQGPPVVPISRVMEQARAGEVSRINVPQNGNEITVEYKNGKSERAIKEIGSMLEQLQRAGVPAEKIPAVEIQRIDNSGGGKLLGFIS
jgi:ATP-dependent Zn protease